MDSSERTAGNCILFSVGLPFTVFNFLCTEINKALLLLPLCFKPPPLTIIQHPSSYSFVALLFPVSFSGFFFSLVHLSNLLEPNFLPNSHLWFEESISTCLLLTFLSHWKSKFACPCPVDMFFNPSIYSSNVNATQCLVLARVRSNTHGNIA